MPRNNKATKYRILPNIPTLRAALAFHSIRKALVILCQTLPVKYRPSDLVIRCAARFPVRLNLCGVINPLIPIVPQLGLVCSDFLAHIRYRRAEGLNVAKVVIPARARDRVGSAQITEKCSAVCGKSPGVDVTPECLGTSPRGNECEQQSKYSLSHKPSSKLLSLYIGASNLTQAGRTRTGWPSSILRYRKSILGQI